MKKIITALFCIILVTAAGCVTPPPTGGGGAVSPPVESNADKAADLFSLAMIAFNSGNLEVSLDYINQAMGIPGVDDQTSTRMRLLRAEIYADLEKYDLADAEIRQIIDKSPDLPEAYYVSALMSYKTGNLAAAETALERTLALKPDFARAQNLLGNIMKERGDLEKALAFYNDAIMSDDTFAPAYFNRAEVDMALEYYDSAVSDYSSAISRYTELQKHYQAQAYCGRAEAFLMKGDVEMSRRDREKADSLYPGICVQEKQTGPRWGKGEVRPQ